MSKADKEQHGGDHYKRMDVQPWNVIDTWPLSERIGFYRGNALKYLMRMHDKDAPVDNVEKAAHYCRKLAEVLEKQASVRNAVSPDDAAHEEISKRIQALREFIGNRNP